MRTWLIAFFLALLPTDASMQVPKKVIEDGVLDHIELFVDALEAPTRASVIVRPFDASAADLGTGGKSGKDVRQQEAKTMQSQGPGVLADSMVANLLKSGVFKEVSVGGPAAPLPPGTLLVEGKFVAIDPGSRAKRYFAGFGAGKSAVEVSGSVVDAQGQVLARFRQRRIGAMGLGGGDSLGKLMSDTRSIGGDIAKFLATWGRNQPVE